MRRLARYLTFFKKEVIIGPIFKLTEAIFELIVPLVMAKIIDVGIQNQNKPYIYQMGGVMILLGVVGLGCALVCQYFASKASQGVGTMIRNDLFRHINTLSHAEIDKLGTSSLVNRITNDVNQIQVAVAMLIRLVIRAPFLVIGATIMAMSINLKLSLIFWLAGILVAIVLYLVMKKSIPFYRVIQKKLDRIGLITRENLEGARVIRAFSKQHAEERRFEQASEDHAKTAIGVGKISALLNPMTFTIMNLAIVLIIWFGGTQVDAGFLLRGEVIALVNYMTQISLALVVVANLVVIFTKASASATRINEVFDTSASIIQKQDKNLTIDSSQAVPKVAFQDVSFSYGDSNEYALEHISFEVYPGETVGIIGATGSGKSTLINLIPRFYEATQGSVLIDGIDVKEYPFKQLRTQIGVVPQKAVLFHGSILDNLRWADQHATQQQIEKAVEIAQGKDFVEKLPNQYLTEIFQGAKNVSGGQKQRLTIARALVSQPKILILDDSSSALDFATDAALRKAIKQDSEDRTVFIVSQRATSIKYADKIIVLDDGCMVGIGTHDELFENCEVYHEICMSQLNSEEASR